MTAPNDPMEGIIQRAAMALGAGVSEEEIAANIQETETPEITFLAIQAAKILNTEYIPEELRDTIPAPPTAPTEEDVNE